MRTWSLFSIHVKTDPKKVNGFFVLYFGNTEGHDRNHVLTLPINKKQFAELAGCVEKREEK